MGWQEFFIVGELNETIDELAQHLRVCISHTNHAGANELRKAHAVLQKLRKQYGALEQVLRETDVLTPALPAQSVGDKVIGDVQAELERLRAKIERVELALPPKKKRTRKGTP